MSRAEADGVAEKPTHRTPGRLNGPESGPGAAGHWTDAASAEHRPAVIDPHRRARLNGRVVRFLIVLKTDEAEMSGELGAPPRSGWAKMVSELHVNDLDASLLFWIGIVGFEVAFQRATERFAYLEHAEGHQIMLCQRHGRFETGPLDYPLGQGAMFQIYLQRLEPVLSRLSARGWPLYLGPREIWRQVGEREHGQQEVFVQDPDGYLLMLAQHLGIRPTEHVG